MRGGEKKERRVAREPLHVACFLASFQINVASSWTLDFESGTGDDARVDCPAGVVRGVLICLSRTFAFAHR